MRRKGILAGVLAAGALLAWDTSAARAQDFFAGPSYGYSRYYDPPGGWPRFGYYGLGSYPSYWNGAGQSWVGVPGLDAGYDQWRGDAERAYGRGDFYIQGWQQGPYPYVQPGYGWPR